MGRYKLRFVIVGLTLAVFGAMIQYSSFFLEVLVKKNVEFKQEGQSWVGNTSVLDPGVYYVSVGRTRTACSLEVDDKKIDSLLTPIEGIRNGFMLGGSFQKSAVGINKIVINCPSQLGFTPRLNQDPIVATPKLGVLLQLWRALTEIFIGPFFSFFLFFLLLLQFKPQSKISTSAFQQFLMNVRSHSGWPHLIFSITAVFYTLSLAYFPMLFWAGVVSLLIHVISRHFFSISLIFLFGYYSKPIKWLIYLHSLAILGMCFIARYFPELLTPAYNWQYTLFPISTAIVTAQLFRFDAKTEAAAHLRAIGVAWFIVQIVDMILLRLNHGMYIAPSTVAMMAGMVAYQQHKERIRDERIEVTTFRILMAINAKGSLKEILVQLATIAAGETHYTRASAYIDAFCVGYADQPYKTFVRVMESGYRKDTTKDSIVDFEQNRGEHMIQATRTGEMLLKKGQLDQAWFTVVPLGKHACLNLSDEAPVSPYSAYESEEILRRLLPALSLLESRLIDHGIRQGFALERLRSIHGDGKWETVVGSVFADINSYSHYTERFGASFSDFVSAIYFPALVKTVAKTAAPEFVRGDEIYFVCLRELFSDTYNVQSSMLETIQEIYNFSHVEGAALCAQNGYPVLTMSLGGSVGMSSVICDPIKVRTAGQSVNDAKRLQEAAGKDKVLIKCDALTAELMQRGVFGEEAPILIKKNFIMARSFLPKIKSELKAA